MQDTYLTHMVVHKLDMYLFTVAHPSWCSMKQTISATSSNYAEMFAIHEEATRECVWLRNMTQHIREGCNLPTQQEPTVIYKDNMACITQLKEGYAKGDRVKHIS